jgi:hypothetical protein
MKVAGSEGLFKGRLCIPTISPRGRQDLFKACPVRVIFNTNALYLQYLSSALPHKLELSVLAARPDSLRLSTAPRAQGLQGTQPYSLGGHKLPALSLLDVLCVRPGRHMSSLTVKTSLTALLSLPLRTYTGTRDRAFLREHAGP